MGYSWQPSMKMTFFNESLMETHQQIEEDNLLNDEKSFFLNQYDVFVLHGFKDILSLRKVKCRFYPLSNIILTHKISSNTLYCLYLLFLCTYQCSNKIICLWSRWGYFAEQKSYLSGKKRSNHKKYKLSLYYQINGSTANIVFFSFLMTTDLCFSFFFVIEDYINIFHENHMYMFTLDWC